MMNILKQLLFPMFLFVSLSGIDLKAQGGIEFFHGSFEEAIELAKKEHKIIFMDAYATWCGPCKRMARDVFTKKEVGDFFNKHFINLKMDMEKGEGPKLASKYKVSAYPTLLFIDEEGEVVNLSKGALPPDRFIALGKASLNKYDKSGDFEEEYNNGNRDPELLKAYAYALKVSGKPALKIANEYLRTQDKKDTEENLDFIFDFATEADCSIFDLLVEHREALIQAKGKEVFKTQVQKACEKTIEKAVEYQTPDLMKEAKDQMKAALPSFYKEYKLLADIQYAYLSNDLAAVFKSTKKYVKKFAKQDAKKLHQHAQMFNQYISDKTALAEAENWAKMAYKLDKNSRFGQTYMELLLKNGKREEAEDLQKELKNLH
jgi:thioredoxin-related protein